MSEAKLVKRGAPDYHSDHQPGVGDVFDTIGDFLDNLFGHGRLTDLNHGL